MGKSIQHAGKMTVSWSLTERKEARRPQRVSLEVRNQITAFKVNWVWCFYAEGWGAWTELQDQFRMRKDAHLLHFQTTDYPGISNPSPSSMGWVGRQNGGFSCSTSMWLLWRNYSVRDDITYGGGSRRKKCMSIWIYFVEKKKSKLTIEDLSGRMCWVTFLKTKREIFIWLK